MADHELDPRSIVLRRVFGANSQYRDFAAFYLGYTSGFLTTEQLEAAWASWEQHLAEVQELLGEQEEAQIKGWEARPQD